MRKHAFLKDNTVVKIESIEESQYSDLARDYQLIIDIEDSSPVPQVGFHLVGNELKSQFSSMTVDQSTAEQQMNQRVFGQKLSERTVDMMGARNLKFTLEGQSPNVSNLLSTLRAIKSLMDTGALKTARGIMIQVKPGFSPYADILDYAISEITNFLTTMSYE